MSQLYIPDIECDSCIRLISKQLAKGNISYTLNEDGVVVSQDKVNEVKEIISKLGFRIGEIPFERKTIRERILHFKENKEKYIIERQGIALGIYTLLALLILFSFSYLVLLKDISNFLPTYGWWIFYLILSVTSISIATWHFFAYKTKFTCMVGMMIGMTFGMQSGMMLGAIIGATNGFFWGSMFGMMLGSGIGIVTGRCCGVMGIMEGAMAGVMGGTMGAMISVMMFSDHLLWFMPFYMIINLFIMLGLSYMLYEEVVEGKNVISNPMDNVTVISLAIIITGLIATFMIWGPTSSLI